MTDIKWKICLHLQMYYASYMKQMICDGVVVNKGNPVEKGRICWVRLFDVCFNLNQLRTST